MFGVVDLIIILDCFISIPIPLIAKKHAPNNLLIGMLLCLFGSGQFYLKDGFKYHIGLIILYIIIKMIIWNVAVFLGTSAENLGAIPGILFMITNLFSMGIMYWRFLQTKKKIKI